MSRDHVSTGHHPHYMQVQDVNKNLEKMRGRQRRDGRFPRSKPAGLQREYGESGSTDVVEKSNSMRQNNQDGVAYSIIPAMNPSDDRVYMVEGQNFHYSQVPAPRRQSA